MSIQEYEEKYNKSWRMWVDFLNPTDEDIIPLMFDYYPPNTPYYAINFNNKDELEYWKENYFKIYQTRFRDYIHYNILNCFQAQKSTKILEISSKQFEKMTTEEKVDILFP